MRNDNKFLVTCVEAEGLIRGQATKTEADALKLYEHFTGLNPAPQYVEVRKLSGFLFHNGKPLRFIKPPEVKH